MCLILIAVDAHPDFKLVLAANRDEYYERPSAPPSFWEEAPEILAGRDLAAGGTWLGITRHGRIAAITNYRDPASTKPNAPSRGHLVSDFLLGRASPFDYLEAVSRESARYNGFNLLVGERHRLLWMSNRSDRRVALSPGIYGVSNHLLDTPWPKVLRAKALFEEILYAGNQISAESLFLLLKDQILATDDRLPRTGVPIEWERILSPVFITSPTYGTRSSSVLLIDREEHVTFLNRTFNGSSEPVTTCEFRFALEPTG